MKRPRARQLNHWAAFFEGTGCVKFANGAVVELTVAEEELLELLLRTPKITVSWDRLTYETARSEQTIRHLMRGLRDKLGSRAIRTHTGRGISVQPHFVGTARFALTKNTLRAIDITVAS
jgi:DNA-binding response OmpR family regulator